MTLLRREQVFTLLLLELLSTVSHDNTASYKTSLFEPADMNLKQTSPPLQGNSKSVDFGSFPSGSSPRNACSDSVVVSNKDLAPPLNAEAMEENGVEGVKSES